MDVARLRKDQQKACEVLRCRRLCACCKQMQTDWITRSHACSHSVVLQFQAQGLERRIISWSSCFELYGRKCRNEAESAIQSATFTSRDALGGVTDKSETFADSVTLWQTQSCWRSQSAVNFLASLGFARSETGQSPGKQMERRGAVQLPIFCLIPRACVSANCWMGNLDSGPTQVAFKLPENWRSWSSVRSGRDWP